MLSSQRKIKCPLVNGACQEAKCVFWTSINVQELKNGVPVSVERGDCSFKWQTVLMHDMASKLFSLQQAIESLRNEVSKSREIVLSLPDYHDGS